MGNHRFMLLVGVRTVTLFFAVFLVANMIFFQFFVIDDRLRIFEHPGVDTELRDAFVKDLALDGSLADQYLNFMAKTFSGEFFMSSAVSKFVPVSDFVYDSAFATVGVLAAVLALSVAIAGLYGFFACKWSMRFRGKVMFLLALISAVAFAVPLLMYFEILLIEIGLDDLLTKTFIVSVVGASVPVTAALVFIFEGLTRRTGPIDLKRPYESFLKIASGRDFRAVMPVFLVYAATCVLLVDAVAFRPDGLGVLIQQAVQRWDYQVLIACIFIVATMVLTAVFVADILSIYASETASRRMTTNHHHSERTAPKEAASSSVPTFRAVSSLLRALKRDRVGMAAVVVLLTMLVAGLLSPFLSTVQDPHALASHEPNVVADGWLNPLPPSLTPSPYTGFTHPLGTDHTGGDVYSLLLYDTLESTGTAILIVALSAAAGIGVALLREVAQRLSLPRRKAAGWIGWMLSDVMIAVPIFLVFSIIYVTGLSWALMTVALLGFLCASFGKGQAARLILDQPRSKDDRPPLNASLASDVLHVGKYVFLFSFFSIAFVEFLFYSVEWFGIGWVDLIASGYSYMAFIRGTWWVIVPPMIMIGLAAGSVFVVMDRLERILHSWSTPPGSTPDRAADD